MNVQLEMSIRNSSQHIIGMESAGFSQKFELVQHNFISGI